MIDQKPFRILLFMIISLFTLSFWTAERHSRLRFDEISREVARAELGDVMQILRDRAEPEVLLYETMFELIRGIERMDAENAKRVETRIQELFPPGAVKYLLFDTNAQVIAGGGFSDTESLCLTSMIRDARWEEEKNKTYTGGDWAKAQEARKTLFQNTYRRYESLNHLFMRPVTMGGERGYIMFGSFYPKTFQSHLLRGHYMNEERIPPGAPADGSICCYISRTLAENSEWVAKRYSVGLPEVDQKILVVDRNSNAPPDGFDPVTWHEIQSRSASASSGIVESKSRMVGFINLSPIDATKIALFPTSAKTSTEHGNTSLAFAFLWILWIAFMGVLLLMNPEKHLALSLANKGAVTLIIAGILPVIGLYWSYQSLSQWQQVIAVSRGYSHLDKKLLTLENRQDLRISKVVTEIQRFLEHPMWSTGSFTTEKIASLTLEVNRDIDSSMHLPIRPNIVHRELGTIFVAGKFFGFADDEIEANTIELIESLLTALQQTFARASGKHGLSVGNMKASVLLEALQSVLGASNLYRLAMATDRLDGHRLMGETLWSYLHLLRDENRKVLMSFFITLERKGMQRRQIYQWSEALRVKAVDRPQEELPEYMFGSNMQGDFIILPDFLSRMPLMQQIVRRRAIEGGMQRLRVTIANRQYLLLARPLRGFDYVGMAIVPVDEIPVELGGRTAVVAILFPFLLIPTIWLLLRRFFLEPVATLTKGVESIAAGNYEVRLPTVSQDELGDLCRSFNNMAQGLKEKEFMSRFLSDLTLDAVRSGERAMATRFRASILFSDIRSFTALSESRSGEEVVEMLNEYLTLMEECIERHGGSIDKFIGDAIMAVFLPVFGKADPALRAVDAAIDMRTALATFNRSRQTAGMFTIKTGIGIASGEVLMGTIGGRDRQDFTVTGRTVNRASAMEKLSKRAGTSFIVVCSETAARVGTSRRYEKIAPPDDNDHEHLEGYELIV